MARTKEPLSAQEVIDAIDKLGLEDKLAVYLSTKTMIDDEQKKLKDQLEGLEVQIEKIDETKAKINGK
jgi:uncharacterized membrane protein YebE (DUF533 family)